MSRQRYVVDMEAVSVSALADAVRRRAAGSPLDRVEAALAVGEELTSGADDLIGQFGDEARHAGCSWTEIAHRIGASKQAAPQRFPQRPALPHNPHSPPRLPAPPPPPRAES